MQPVRVVRPTDVLAQRAGAWLIDVTIAWSIALAVAGVALAAGAGAARSALGALVALPVAWLTVVAGVESRTGASPGKHCAGLRVVDESGRPASRDQVLRRHLWWALDALPYVFPVVGTAAAAGDDDARRLGDRAAGTYVVARRYLGSPPHAATVAAPATGAAIASGAALATPTAGDTEPALDLATGTFRRWDARHESWFVFDEAARRWRPLDAHRVAVLPPRDESSLPPVPAAALRSPVPRGVTTDPSR